MKFPNLPASSALDGTEIVPVTQGGVDKRTTLSAIRAWVIAQYSATVQALVGAADAAAARTAISAAQDRRTVTVVTPAAGVATLDLSLGDYFTLAPTADVTSIVFSNLPGAGKGAHLRIRLTQDATPRAYTWPASFKWPGGVAGVVSTGAGDVDLLELTTFDNGTTWRAVLTNDFA